MIAARRAQRSRIVGRLHLLVLVLAVIGALTAAVPAWAAPARVLVFRPHPPSAVLEEALVRVRGELAAVGLVVEVRPLEEAPRSDGFVTAPGTYGGLLLDQTGEVIRIRAYSPDSSVPVEQQVDSADSNVDAEVVAVRAVETLRAVMLEYARRAREKDEEIPDPVTGFTRIGPAQKKPPRSPPRAPIDTPSPRAGESASWLGLRAGPELALDTTALSPSAGVGAALRLRPRWYFLELGGSVNFLPARASRAAGEVELTRSALDLRAGGVIQLSEALELSLSVGGGAGSYAVRGIAAEGYVGRSTRHFSALASSALACELYPTRHLGAYASVHGTFAFDAPRVRVDGRTVATAKQPELAGSIGVALRL